MRTLDTLHPMQARKLMTLLTVVTALKTRQISCHHLRDSSGDTGDTSGLSVAPLAIASSARLVSVPALTCQYAGNSVLVYLSPRVRPFAETVNQYVSH